MIRISRLLITALITALTGTADLCAQTYSDPWEGYNEETFMDMEFEPNLATPAVPQAEKAAVTRYVRSTAEKLKRRYTIDLFREGEVMIISIPTDDLFLPNDTLLSNYAPRSLDPLLPLLQDPDMYKLVIAMHTDDTGSETYREDLSTARLNSIYDWFMTSIDNGRLSEDQIIIPFSMASTEPVVANDTRRHRALNRRLEIYFLPGPAMIRKAHENQLN